MALCPTGGGREVEMDQKELELTIRLLSQSVVRLAYGSYNTLGDEAVHLIHRDMDKVNSLLSGPEVISPPQTEGGRDDEN